MSLLGLLSIAWEGGSATLQQTVHCQPAPVAPPVLPSRCSLSSSMLARIVARGKEQRISSQLRCQAAQRNVVSPTPSSTFPGSRACQVGDSAFCTAGCGFEIIGKDAHGIKQAHVKGLVGGWFKTRNEIGRREGQQDKRERKEEAAYS